MKFFYLFLSYQVKQETKVLRDFEDGLCHNYRLFLEFLETMAKGKYSPMADIPKT